MHARKKNRREAALKRWRERLALVASAPAKPSYTAEQKAKDVRVSQKEIEALEKVLGLIQVKSSTEKAAEELARAQGAAS